MPEDRDIRRPKTPPAGVRAQTAAPEPVFDDPTGQCERGEIEPQQRDELRKKRPTDERLAHIEKRNDEQDMKLGALTSDVAFIKGQLVVLPSLVAQAIRGTTQRQHLALKVEADVAAAEAKATIEDGLDAKKARRKLLTRIAGAAAIAVGGMLAHYLLAKIGLL